MLGLILNANSKLTYVNQIVNLDGNRYADCVFKTCHMIFSAAAPVSLIRCEINECTWGLTGAAALTIDFVKALHGQGWHGERLTEDAFDLIRGIRPLLSS
jgi:hypothetical protein